MDFHADVNLRYPEPFRNLPRGYPADREKVKAVAVRLPQTLDFLENTLFGFAAEVDFLGGVLVRNQLGKFIGKLG